ncbi:putative glutamate synthase (NADPH) small subunit [Mycobacterium lentiflavum]|uniref:Putative glutamate synthase (NADPH) small subunit n=1 Tax=Mycobacterium lentiflavum TaxID=141349 RepID=A0A0E4GYZ2_MYCLN|nr:putative glutamate synthase (NADPH) small subunit [Mycobacterium lentiflavum]
MSSDLTPLPDLLHGQARAGPVREHRPGYTDNPFAAIHGRVCYCVGCSRYPSAPTGPPANAGTMSARYNKPTAPTTRYPE